MNVAICDACKKQEPNGRLVTAMVNCETVGELCSGCAPKARALLEAFFGQTPIPEDVAAPAPDFVGMIPQGVLREQLERVAADPGFRNAMSELGKLFGLEIPK